MNDTTIVIPEDFQEKVFEAELAYMEEKSQEAIAIAQYREEQINEWYDKMCENLNHKNTLRDLAVNKITEYHFGGQEIESNYRVKELLDSLGLEFRNLNGWYKGCTGRCICYKGYEYPFDKAKKKKKRMSLIRMIVGWIVFLSLTYCCFGKELSDSQAFIAMIFGVTFLVWSVAYTADYIEICKNKRGVKY